MYRNTVEKVLMFCPSVPTIYDGDCLSDVKKIPSKFGFCSIFFKRINIFEPHVAH